MARRPAKLALGAAIAAGFIAYYVALETSCATISQHDGSGELVITSGGAVEGTQTGTRLLAPGGQIPSNGTADAPLLWIKDLCEAVLDCSSCPHSVNPHFNASVLDGALLVQWWGGDERLAVCGSNRLLRALGRIGLVGLAWGGFDNAPSSKPGYNRHGYRLGEHRDALPHDGDAGIPFATIHLDQYALDPVLHALEAGVRLRAVVTPTAPNPWHSTMCGYWKPLRTILMLGHMWVAEQAASCFIGHAQSVGVRFDLAQAASTTEWAAHLLMMLGLHDPFMAFHWGLLPFGTVTPLIVCPIFLTCSSTLLLAGLW